LSEAIQPTLPRGGHGATILVVEDDPRIVELLHIALGAHGFRVVSALNGDDGWRMLVDDPPDLAIFDVRLPRRSGLDLVESVRREPSLLHLPVILVSALAETESRLAGLARGADDYLAKPFSPKELVARVRRMLARAEDTKSLVRRNHELLAEVERSRGDLKRLNHDLRREFWVKDAFLALSQELSNARRVEEVAGVLLRSLASHLGVSTGAVLVAGPEGGPLTSVESRGWSDDRLHRLVLSGDGELARLVAGLARPVRRAELERFRELETERRPLVAAGVALLVPLVTRGRLVGAVVLPEKRAGGEFEAGELEVAEALAAAGATALDNTRLYRQAEEAYLRALHALLPAVDGLDPRRGGRARGMAEVAASLARELGLDPAAIGAVRVGALASALGTSCGDAAEAASGAPAAGPGTLETEILSVVESYFAYLEGAGPGMPAPDDVRRWFEQAPAGTGRGFDRQVTEALDELLRRGDPTIGLAA
jgi:two-component system OmpR family response regulator